jgi:2-polyprenyl-3-methyl-5-hydroxy-6-metoxy-1,4-benzoquinol methylase
MNCLLGSAHGVLPYGHSDYSNSFGQLRAHVRNSAGVSLIDFVRSLTPVKEWLDVRSLKRVLKDIPGDDLKVSDVGGGSDWLADLARGVDSRVSVTQIVDLDESARLLAEKAGHRYFCGRFEDFVTRDRYDLILMLNLIEHVSNPRKVLVKARKLLTPGGRIYIQTPNFRALDDRIFRHSSWAGYHCSRHFVLFTPESFTRLINSLELHIASLKYTQGACFWSVSILEILRRRGLIRGACPEQPAIFHPLIPFLQTATAAFDFIRKSFASLSQMIFVVSQKHS